MVSNFRKTASRFTASLCIVLFCLFVASNSLGETGDVIDDFLYYSTACRGYTNAVWADVDDNGEYDTQVVFTTIDGHGYPTSEFAPPGKWYFSTYQTCAGEPESSGDHSYLFRHHRGLIISHLYHFTDESESIKLNLLRIDDGSVLVTLSML
jgi:hypothetical protein